MKLNLENIKFSYGNVHFHYNLNIKHSVTGIFGYSGAGKTTLINLISGVETPHSGRLSCRDRTYFDRERNINVPVNKRNVGIVFQEKYLFPHMSVLKNLEYGQAYRKDMNFRFSQDCVIDLMDLKKLVKKKPYQLSGGERQRVAIGRCLLSEPDILLMDEPFSNLDMRRKDEIISYLKSITTEYDIPLLIISHDLEDILKLTRHLVVIERGKVKATGDFTELSSLENGHGLPLRTISPVDEVLLSKVG